MSTKRETVSLLRASPAFFWCRVRQLHCLFTDSTRRDGDHGQVKGMSTFTVGANGSRFFPFSVLVFSWSYFRDMSSNKLPSFYWRCYERLHDSDSAVECQVSYCAWAFSECMHTLCEHTIWPSFLTNLGLLLQFTVLLSVREAFCTGVNRVDRYEKTYFKISVCPRNGEKKGRFGYNHLFSLFFLRFLHRYFYFQVSFFSHLFHWSCSKLWVFCRMDIYFVFLHPISRE